MNNKTVLGGLVIVTIVVVLVLFLTSRNKSLSPMPASMITANNPANSKSTVAPTRPFADRQERVVNLKASGFNPKTIKVQKGTLVKWVNQSGGVGSVYSNNHPTHLGYPPLNLGQFTNGSSLEFLFTSTGAYGYHDHINPNRTGEVIVE